MTEELQKKAEDFIIDRYKIAECYREDNAETREYMRMDVHSQYEKEYQLYLDATKELQKENANLKDVIEGYKKIVKWCDKCDKLADFEAKLKHAEENCINKTCVIFKDKEDCVAKLLELEKENNELKSDNDARKFAMAMSEKVEKQLREENAKLKDEWQEQVQKATDEGYARTLQTMQLSKAKELLAKWVELYKPKLEGYPITPIQEQTEQFFKDLEK